MIQLLFWIAYLTKYLIFTPIKMTGSKLVCVNDLIREIQPALVFKQQPQSWHSIRKNLNSNFVHLHTPFFQEPSILEVSFKILFSVSLLGKTQEVNDTLMKSQVSSLKRRYICGYELALMLTGCTRYVGNTYRACRVAYPRQNGFFLFLELSLSIQRDFESSMRVRKNQVF